jgi:uncharacterized protein (TIGR00661 family)
VKHKTTNKNILIATLNWGLGHATRCIPIINALIEEGFKPILAGDGDSLKLLQFEFPELRSYTLPSYNIQYTKKGKHLKYKLLLDAPKILKAVKEEQQVVSKIIKKENIHGIISDNRFGVRSNKIPSVYITHQIQVLSGITTFFTSKFHQNIISQFDECWIPDYKESPNLAGELSHTNNSKLNLKYIGPISRFDKEVYSFEEIDIVKKFDILVLLSGPEPQRTLLEKKLLNELKIYPKKVLFVRGIISDKEISLENTNVKIVNFMLQKDLQKVILESKIILARSGYSTIMDLEKLGAKGFFIPTPGQFEQEYLAKYLEEQNIASYAFQNDFKISLLDNCKNYLGFKPNEISTEKLNSFPFDIFKNDKLT